MDIIETSLREFCLDYVQNPYHCYTEHGFHAAYYARLLPLLPTMTASWNGRQVCLVQKEYPTATDLGKPRRQHWDIAVLRNPLSPIVGKPAAAPDYDYFHLEAAIEFSLNEGADHLKDDIERLTGAASDIDSRYIVLLYRLSEVGSRLSGRDKSTHSVSVLSLEKITQMSASFDGSIFYALVDNSRPRNNGVWLIQKGACIKL